MIQGMVLNPETKEAATLLAELTFQKYARVRGHYRNTASSHLVGHLGEFAAFIWLRDNGFDPIAYFLFQEKEKECDIASNAGRIEVKTWSKAYWEDYGRCISVSQLPSIQKKCDIIFWCSVDEVESATPNVQFRGWSKVSDFEGVEPKMTGVPGRQINNYQLDISSLHPVEKMGEI